MKITECIDALKALGEENRLSIVRLLLKRASNVNEIAESLKITQYNVSKHLRVLREAGLLVTEKQGQQRVYSLTPDFHRQITENNYVLDLGCCTFRFD